MLNEVNTFPYYSAVSSSGAQWDSAPLDDTELQWHFAHTNDASLFRLMLETKCFWGISKCSDTLIKHTGLLPWGPLHSHSFTESPAHTCTELITNAAVEQKCLKAVLSQTSIESETAEVNLRTKLCLSDSNNIETRLD